MANAKRCDRCNCYYEHYEGEELIEGGNKYNWLRLFTAHGSSYQTFDLCPDCMDTLIRYLKREFVMVVPANDKFVYADGKTAEEVKEIIDGKNIVETVKLVNIMASILNVA